MIVDLRTLKPNPMRDLTVDPIDEDRVEAITASIKENGFWLGVPLRRLPDGELQIAAGHHRVLAAVAAGIPRADLPVRDEWDEGDMVRVYATENATQRGNTSTALAGSVAGAIRFLAKEIMTGGVSRKFAINQDLAKLQGNLASDRGLGEPIITTFLKKHRVPDVGEAIVKQQLANLKASGDYARIITEVTEDVERESQTAAKEATKKGDTKEAEKQQQAGERAAKTKRATTRKPKTFDFKGVARHLTNPHQLAVFREQVTGKGIAPYLPVSHQAALAEEIVRLAKKEKKDGEVTGAFIRLHVTQLVLEAKATERRLNQEEQERLHQQDLYEKAKHYQREFSRHLRMMAANGATLAELERKWPKGLAFPISAEFREAVRLASAVIEQMRARILPYGRKG